MTKYNAIVMGVSAGGIEALTVVLPVLSADISVPVFIVHHRTNEPENFLVSYLDNLCKLNVVEAASCEAIQLGKIYFAPGGYHLMIEREHTLSLSVDAPVCFSIPSVDVLFESAASVYKETLIGVILTGANSDGSLGLKKVREAGGLAIVQDPDTANTRTMPQSAIDISGADHILALDEIGPFLMDACHGN